MLTDVYKNQLNIPHVLGKQLWILIQLLPVFTACTSFDLFLYIWVFCLGNLQCEVLGPCTSHNELSENFYRAMPPICHLTFTFARKKLTGNICPPLIGWVFRVEMLSRMYVPGNERTKRAKFSLN